MKKQPEVSVDDCFAVIDKVIIKRMGEDKFSRLSDRSKFALEVVFAMILLTFSDESELKKFIEGDLK